MAKIIETTDPIVLMVHDATDFRSWAIKLAPNEISILQKANTICERAGELQAEVLKRQGHEDDGDDNDYTWASIYLGNILSSK